MGEIRYREVNKERKGKKKEKKGIKHFISSITRFLSLSIHFKLLLHSLPEDYLIRNEATRRFHFCGLPTHSEVLES